MKRKILGTAATAALLVLALSAVAHGAKHKTSIYANYSESSTSGYVFGSLSSPYLNCKKRRTVTAEYTSTTGELVSISDKTDVLGYFRIPDLDNLVQPPAGPVTVSVKKKRVKPFDSKHICKKKSAPAVPIQY